MIATRTVALAVAGVVALGGAGAFALLDREPEGFAAPASTTEVVDLDWDMLVPEGAAVTEAGVVNHEQIGDETAPWQSDTDVTKVRRDLDGERVRIPGYMTPLSWDSAEVSRFLLVPYVGACVHVPPPPANQIVHVEVDGTVPVLEMWEPFLAVGTLRAEPQSTELAEVAYSMELEHLEIYEESAVEVFDDTAGAEPPAAAPADADAAASELGRVFDEAFGPPGTALQ